MLRPEDSILLGVSEKGESEQNLPGSEQGSFAGSGQGSSAGSEQGSYAGSEQGSSEGKSCSELNAVIKFFNSFEQNQIKELDISEILTHFEKLESLLSKKTKSEDIENIINQIPLCKTKFESIYSDIFGNRISKETIDANSAESFFKLVLSIKNKTATNVGILHKPDIKKFYEKFQKDLKKGIIFKNSKNKLSANTNQNNAKFPKLEMETKVSFEIQMNLNEILNKYKEMRTTKKSLCYKDAIIILQKLHNAHDSFQNSGPKISDVDWELIKSDLRKEKNSLLNPLLQQIAEQIIPNLDLEQLSKLCYHLSGSTILQENLHLSIEKQFNNLISLKELQGFIFELGNLGTNKKAQMQLQNKSLVEKWPTLDNMIDFSNYFSNMRCDNTEVIQGCCDASYLSFQIFLKDKNNTEVTLKRGTIHNQNKVDDLERPNRCGDLIHSLFILVNTLPNLEKFVLFKTDFSGRMSNAIIDFISQNKNPNYWISQSTWKHWACFLRNYSNNRDYEELERRGRAGFSVDAIKTRNIRKANGFEEHVLLTLNNMLKETVKNYKGNNPFTLENEYFIEPFQYDHFLKIKSCKYHFSIEDDGIAFHHLIKINADGRFSFEYLDGKTKFKQKWALQTYIEDKNVLPININQNHYYLFKNDKQKRSFIASLFIKVFREKEPNKKLDPFMQKINIMAKELEVLNESLKIESPFETKMNEEEIRLQKQTEADEKARLEKEEFVRKQKEADDEKARIEKEELERRLNEELERAQKEELERTFKEELERAQKEELERRFKEELERKQKEEFARQEAQIQKLFQQQGNIAYQADAAPALTPQFKNIQKDDVGQNCQASLQPLKPFIIHSLSNGQPINFAQAKDNAPLQYQQQIQNQKPLQNQYQMQDSQQLFYQQQTQNPPKMLYQQQMQNQYPIKQQIHYPQQMQNPQQMHYSQQILNSQQMHYSQQILNPQQMQNPPQIQNLQQLNPQQIEFIKIQQMQYLHHLHFMHQMQMMQKTPKPMQNLPPQSFSSGIGVQSSPIFPSFLPCFQVTKAPKVESTIPLSTLVTNNNVDFEQNDDSDETPKSNINGYTGIKHDKSAKK